MRRLSNASKLAASEVFAARSAWNVSIALRTMKSTVSIARPVCSANTMSSRAIWRAVSPTIAARNVISWCTVATTISSNRPTAIICSERLTDMKPQNFLSVGVRPVAIMAVAASSCIASSIDRSW